VDNFFRAAPRAARRARPHSPPPTALGPPRPSALGPIDRSALGPTAAQPQGQFDFEMTLKLKRPETASKPL